MIAFAELAARSNFSFLDGALHPEELVATSQALGLGGIGICDLNSLACVVRGHVAAMAEGLPFLVGCRLRLDDGSEWLAWPLAVDVNASDWDSSLEERLTSTGFLALRLGLRLVAGLQEAEARAILAARQARNGAPFASVEEAAWRAGVGQRALAALAGADAFASTGANRRRAGWDARGVVHGPATLPLFAAATAAALVPPEPLMLEPAATLPPQSEGETVIEDYRSTGLSLGRHPLALLRPALDRLGLGDTRQLDRLRAGSSIRLPGLVLMR